MALGLGWSKIDGKLQPGEVVAPDERLGWGRTLGLGAQHVVAMFGATFVFPLIMGLNPQLAILMSGIATICFLLIVKGKVPSYLGTSASFVGGVAAIYAQQGTPQEVTGAILIAGVILALVGVFIHVVGAHLVYKVLPPVVTGAVVMLIGFNLAPVVANIYWPQDQWIALHRHGGRDPDERRAARLPRPDLDLPRAAARVRAVLGLRPDLRPDHLVQRRDRRGRHALPGRTGPASPTRPGSASRPRPTWPTASSAGTCRASTWSSSCW